MATKRWTCLLSVVALGLGLGTPHTCLGQVAAQQLAEADASLLIAYGEALQQPHIREASLAGFLRQMRHNPTVGVVESYWATPLDLSSVLLLPDVRPAVESLLPKGPAARGALELISDSRRLKQLVAFAFSPTALREPLGLRVLGESDQVADSQPTTWDIVIVPVRDADWAVNEYLPPIPTGLEEEQDCHFFCLDPNTWDFDGDGVPDVTDPDNDNDGVEDRRDQYPNLPTDSTCACNVEPFVLFVTKFARGMTNALLAAYATVSDGHAADDAITLGAAPGGGHVRFALPLSARAADPGRSCPAADDRAVRYVSMDPEACALIRYRCEEGEIGFSSDCGCGCRQP